MSTNLVYISGEIVGKDGNILTIAHDSEKATSYFYVIADQKVDIGENVVIEGHIRNEKYEDALGYVSTRTYISASKIIHES